MALTRNTKPKISYEDIDFIKSQLVVLSKQNENLDRKLEKFIVDDFKTLNAAVVGNKEYEQEGIAGKLKRHDDYIEKDKSFKQRFAGATMVLGLIWSYFLKWATK